MSHSSCTLIKSGSTIHYDLYIRVLELPCSMLVPHYLACMTQSSMQEIWHFVALQPSIAYHLVVLELSHRLNLFLNKEHQNFHQQL